ncbi:MAG TPA: amino acid adenylation domain-containing protein, partial [Thermoanaerobaculia bacterium]|nr:amino acid adenylation domain-containing protein [Thermoanaerobaculia bacterium]
MAETVVTREALLERVWELAERALGAWALERPALHLLEHKKNATFQVEAADGALTRRYVLRVCDPDGHGEAEIRSELCYLLALGPATGLVVPEPVRARDGSLVVRVEGDELERPRWCALFRWVPGRMVADAPTPRHLEQVGEIAGQLHRFSEEWQPPAGFSRPRWDAAGLFGTGPVLAPGQGAPLVGERARDLLEEAAGAVRETMAALGQERDVFGLIHKDLEPDNTVVERTEDGERVHPIDFADLGWGYYLYDIAASLLPLREKPGFAAMREAFLRGYRRIRPLPAEQVELLETFFIARGIFSVRLMTGRLSDLPHVRRYAATAVPQILGGIRLFLEQRRSSDATRTTVQVLALLRDRGVKLWAEGEKLRYSAPPGALTPELKTGIKERKAELLGFLRQGHVARRSGAPSRIEAARVERPPLSFAQQRLWLLHQLFPGSVEYNIARAVRLRGEVRVDLLAASLREIVRRHGALRTTFAVDGGQPVQVVAPELAIPLPLVDLTGLPSGRREAEAWRLAQEDAALPFDLARGPLLRVFLLRLDAEDHIAPSTMHHVIGDGWSTGILFREMGLVYGALTRGLPPSLPPLPVQYVDFAVWQRRWLTGEVLEEQLAYWKEQLAGAPPELELPTDRPRAGVQSARGDRRPLLIPPPLAESLRELGQAQGATLFMVLLAAWQTLLCRISGQDDVVTGSPIANRNRTEIEGLIGCFVNTLVLRTVFAGDPAFREVLAEARKTTLGAYAHQDLPFEKIVEELRPERSLTQTPLFQVIFTLQNVPSPDMEVEGFRMTLMPPTRRAAMVDLACNMKEMPDGVRTSFMYKEDLFDGATIERLAAQYLRLLEAVAAQPGRGIREIPLLSPAEERQLLEWGGAREQHTSGETLATLFEAQVERTPEARAVTCDGTDLTYAELNHRAGQLAQWLRRAGVRPETRVGLRVERSPELIVGMLGIVKAGGAYLPLDPAYPRERLAFLMEDAGVRVVVTQKDFKDTKDFKDGGECLESLQSLGPTPQNTAYVIYTSGSTGKPKGVQVTHHNVVRLLAATQPWFGFGPGDVWTLFHSSAFDFSVWEIWGALLTGGRLVIVPWEVSRTPEAFHDLLARERVTVLNQTPTAFGELLRVDEDREGELTDLRLVIFGGEALAPARLAPWFARYGDDRPRLVNMYGITETTVHVTYRPLSAQDQRSVIGIPIPDLAVRVLDRSGQLAPIGVPGELAVGGAGLARGYLGRPDLTAERFVPDPFSGPGARLYRSGDLGRFLPSGELEYLGRIDHQVKIRGFRIEPGEIEAALLAHPEVREAVVLVREDRLVAYAVVDRTDPTDPTDRSDPRPALAAWLRDRLPQHMLPSAFVLLDALPLTANGKVDRKALLALDEAAGTEAGFAAPRTPAEELVAGLFAEVLNVETVGAEDHFFELGGHSLLATQLLSRLRQTFGVELPLRTLFEQPTVAALARAVRLGDAPAAPPLVPVPRDAPLPLSFAQQRLWLFDQLEPDNPAYNVFGAVRLLGAARRDLLQARLEAVVRRHETLRTTFAQQDGAPVQVVHAWLPPDVAALDLTALAPAAREGELRRLAQAELLRPFDLARGPLLRARFIALGPEESAALLAMHHIVSDEWSMRVLVEELCGASADLPELPVQYADYAVWQRGWLHGAALAAELAFWREHLAGAPELLALPTDRPRPAVQTFQGTSSGQHLPAELAGALRAAARARSITPFMLYLTAFQALLGRITGESEIVIGSPIAGRNRLETERLIGFFVNTLALRASLPGRSSLGGLLARTRETVLAAHAHQDLPFELLVEELNPRRSLSHTPLFQVMMNLGTAGSTGALELPGVMVAPLEGLRSGIAPFDLTLSVVDRDERTRLVFEYSTDLFDASTVERLHGYLRQVLHAVAAAPETGLHDVELWSPAERHQVLTEWNDTAAETAAGRGLHGLFEAWARERPGAPAVFFDDGFDNGFEDGSWSYAELSGRAGRLARHLRGLGVGPEQVVGVLAAGGPELALGMLAVLKAGGAFLPLDPRWPAARRAALLEDAGARLVLGGAELPLDGEEALSGPSVSARAVHPEQAAYVFYTSGSTGRPKGVLVSHGAAMTFAVEVARRCGLGAEDRFLQFASPGFDVLIEEVFPVWARGGAAVFAPQEELLTPAGLERVLERQAVTALELPTPYWNEWMDDLERRGAAPPRSLRRLLLGSEKPSIPRLARWDRHGVPVLHVFGLTETTVTSTIHRWERNGSAPAARDLPIGRPVGNTRLYVLDREGAPVPGGVAGELSIGGSGVARGYLGRPDLTAERFVPDPFSSIPGARVYRTGDLARYRADGTLDFLGRSDDQVKVRGVRVEPGEVAAVLAAHPGVREAVVLVREDRLVAYVVLDRTDPTDRSDLDSMLAAWLRDRLPEIMIPSAFMILEALPRTANGKIDRAALPDPEQEEAAGEAPRTPVEELLAGIWSEVLGRPPIGRDEDFFALGGHSLLATRVVSRVRQALGVELPLRALFEAPTVAGLARAAEARRGPAPPPLLPVPRQGDLPLSFAQQRLWLIDQLEPGSAAYNIPAALRLRGALEPALLARIFAEVVRRHEVLRTTFAPRAGGPVQVVASAASARPELPLIDLARLPEAERESAARGLARDEGVRPFDLGRGPLLRLRLVSLGAQEHLLLVTMHHIVADGWSVDVLIREVAALYEAFSHGQVSPLPELPVQYADFAVWQRDWLQGAVLEAQLAVWKRRLAGAPQVLDLPADRPRPAVPTSRGAERPVALPAGLAAAVREVSRREGATPFMTLLAAWAIVLGRHANQDDLLVGAPVAGRNRQETEGLIGFFVNTLVLRADLSGTPAFVEALRRVREAALEAFTHQDLPFERLVEEVATRRDLARSPLIQVLFALQTGFDPKLDLPGLALSPFEAGIRSARFELILNLEEKPEGISGALEHSTDLYDAPTVERLAGHFQTLLEAAVAAPATTIAELPLLSAAEERQLLELGGVRDEITEGETLATLFEAQVRKAPGARAVSCEGSELTYAELDRRAGRLAHRLRRLGVGPETRVGLRVERSLELVVGLLGIVKAGGAYVPLDPAYPPERLAFLIEDAGAQVVVGAEGIEQVPPLPGGWECGWERGLGGEGPPRPATAQNTAYVIYTSGSTGKPKGVLVTHHNAVRLLAATQPWFGFGPGDVWTLFHSSAFDFSVWEIWGALLTGGRLVVVPWEVSRTPEAFHDLLAAERVTVLNQTPTAFGELLRADEHRSALADLRLVIFGGEALVPARLTPWFSRYGDERPRLVNMYGITETTVHVTYRPLSTEDQRSVIGIPIPDLAVRVLDPAGRLAPIGVPGEIAVGGAGLARGYLGRPDLTAERFVPDPFSGPGARLYRSGDLGRFLPSGELEYLGRIDQQVKIRGFRIEPGEIEAALLAHPGVREAVVLVREDRLIACVVLDPTDPTDPRSALAAWLGDRLPQHLLPSAFVRLDALPLTANGKVDRKALLALDEAPQPEGGFVAPRTPAEELVAGLFAEVLGVENVGAEAHFFELGGHSLLATQLMSRLRQTFGVELPLRTLFEQPTVAALAGAVRLGQAP